MLVMTLSENDYCIVQYFLIDNNCVFMQNGDHVSYEFKHFPLNAAAERTCTPNVIVIVTCI